MPNKIYVHVVFIFRERLSLILILLCEKIVKTVVHFVERPFPEDHFIFPSNNMVKDYYLLRK